MIPVPILQFASTRLITGHGPEHGGHSPDVLGKFEALPLDVQQLTVSQSEQPELCSTSLPRTPCLLDLPPEVRQRIYGYAVNLPRIDHVSLLCACKQVYHEAKVSYYERPLVCNSQLALMSFTERQPPCIRLNIVRLKLRLAEPSPEIMQPYLAQVVLGQLPTSGMHPYSTERDRIVKCLECLPNIQYLSILRPTSRNITAASRTVVDGVLSWVSKHYQLRHLTIDAEIGSLESLSELRSLSYLRTNGESETPPERLAELFPHMSKLQHLHLISFPRSQVSGGGDISQVMLQSITPAVLSKMNPLRSLTICRALGAGNTEDLFLSPDMVRALFRKHCDSLVELNITMNIIPTPEFLAFLSTYLLNTFQIRRLSLNWRRFDVLFLDCLPRSIETLELAIDDQTDAASVIRRLKSISYRLPYLSHIKFNIINEISIIDLPEQKQIMAFGLPILGPSLYTSSSWRISWGIFQPYPLDL